MNKIRKIFFLLILRQDFINGNIFTSTANMEKLLNGQINALHTVSEYINAEYQRHKILVKMARDYETQSRLWMQQIDRRFLGNPVAAYLILKHLSTGWIEIEKMMRSNTIDDVLSKMDEDEEDDSRLFAPTRFDVEGAAVAIMRLQDTYQLDVNLLANGYWPGVPQFSSLSARDCFDIAAIALDQKNDYHASAWFEESLKRSRLEETPTIMESRIFEALSAILYRNQNYVRAYFSTKRLLELEPNHPEAAKNLELYRSEAIKNDIEFLEEIDEADWPSFDIIRPPLYGNVDENYESLCRGEMQQSPGLYCYYNFGSPFLRLAPIKTEIANFKPMILIFRNVVSEEDIEVIKKIATPTLLRSKVSFKDGSVFAKFRISSNTWLDEEDDHQLVTRLNRRIADITGLNMEYAENLQIANYGLGGYYKQHHDCGIHYMGLHEKVDYHKVRYKKLSEDEEWANKYNDRIATVMFYLSQPISGGATVFPRANVTVFPTSGDALFWYNMLKNGLDDEKVLHAACPVLAGQKWVANKWISVREQEFIRRCGLDKNE